MLKTTLVIITVLLSSLLFTQSVNAGWCTPCPHKCFKNKCCGPTYNPCKKTESVLCHRNFSRTVRSCCKCKTTHYTEVTFKVVDACGRTRIYKEAYKAGSKKLVKLGIH